jgi:predicted phage tail component-like protein
VLFRSEHIIVEGTEIPVGKMELGTGDILVGSEVEIFGTRVDTEGEYHKVLSVFTYDQTSDLKIRLYGQYQSVSTTCDDRWAGIGLYQNYQTEYDEPTNLLSSPDALLGDSSSSDITLISNDVSAEYQFNLAIPTLTNPLSFFTGAELKINSFGETNSGIEASIITPNLNSNTKSNYIATTGTITFGDMMDLWGLSSTDIMGETIQLSLKFSNTSLSEETLSYNNLTLTLYYVEDSTGGSQGFTAKNIHSLNYQLFLLDVDIPEGPDRDIGTVNFPLSDGETIVNYSLKSKDIKITFAVWGDTLEETSQKLRNINKWLTNSRNTLSIPEPYDLIFDFRPDMTYKVILGEPIDTNIKYTAVECDATFTVESGVALTTETKITGPVGSNDGIIKVKPDINILCDGSTSITLTDTISNQTMTINTTITDGTLITINCTDRTITDESDNDYTTDVDVESIWFNLISDYNFNCEGGVVQSVSFKEGY